VIELTVQLSYTISSRRDVATRGIADELNYSGKASCSHLLVELKTENVEN
jgi:hypothetical protein